MPGVRLDGLRRRVASRGFPDWPLPVVTPGARPVVALSVADCVESAGAEAPVSFGAFVTTPEVLEVPVPL